jgi:hypothetical protein
MLEEMGARIEIISELGRIDSYREQRNYHAKCCCYVVRQVGELQKPSMTKGEQSLGFKIVWAKNIDAAIFLMKSGRPTEYEDDFIKLRELTFLEYYKGYSTTLR